MHKSSQRVSGALQALAPHHAKQVAELIPFPHHQFFELAPARMHLLGLALATIPPEAIDLNRLTAPKWADAVSIISDPAPSGIEGILSDMPLPMWSEDQYHALWQALQCPTAKRMLQHANDLSPNLISILVRLPPKLRTARVTNHLRHPAEAEVLAQVLDTNEKTERLLRSLGTNETRQTLYTKVSGRRTKCLPTQRTLSMACWTT